MEIVVYLREDLTEEEKQNIIYIIDNMYGVVNVYLK